MNTATHDDEPYLADLYRLSHAADRCNIGRVTLTAACNRNDLPSYTTACGLRLVTLEDVRAWKRAGRGKNRTRKPGPKPREEDEE
ncbi:MAG: hypothetical protein AAGB04_00155 [Pseudomonadota bacterium]